MIDFPITDLLDDDECLAWLERHLHPQGLVCPTCGSSDRRLFRRQRIPAYRCRACHAYYTVLSGTVFAKTRQSAATLVLLLRGVAKGESTANAWARSGSSFSRTSTIRCRTTASLATSSRPTSCTRTRGKKGRRHPEPADPPRRRANKRKGRGTSDNDRPPIIAVVSRTIKTYRYWVVEHADKRSSRETVEASIAPEGTLFFTDEGANYTGLHPQHATVCHGKYEWARDDDGDGRREVHCNSCEGAGAALRTFLRVFRGFHKYFLAEYVATFETLMNAKHITPAVVQHMCFGELLHASDS